jgi:hypothetical protein
MVVCLRLTPRCVVARRGIHASRQAGGRPFHMPHTMGAVLAVRAPAGSGVTDLTLAMD